MKRLLLLFTSHAAVLAAGFALGIYVLPILVAPGAPPAEAMAITMAEGRWQARFTRDLADSDWLHWGEGTVAVGPKRIAFEGRLAPGPDYKLYLSPQFVQTEADFHRLKAGMVRLGDVRGFHGFIMAVPEGIDVAAYNSVIIWCETFQQFITAAKYR